MNGRDRGGPENEAAPEMREADAQVELAQLQDLVVRIFRDRHEPDKVAAYCLQARPDLVETARDRIRGRTPRR